MNPLKTLFNKVFESTPPQDPLVLPREEPEFEWNPDEETVAPTSARALSWRRDPDDDDVTKVPGETRVPATSRAQDLRAPAFEPGSTQSAVPVTEAETPAWKTAAVPLSDPVLLGPVQTVTPPPVAETTVVSAPATPTAAVFSPARPHLPLSDFEDVYRKAGIKSPVHGYGVERVYRLITSRRLAGLDLSVRRSALLTALDAAGVPPSDVSQDAVLRRKALTAYEAEKALELQSLRSRNESRAEALQDTVETFTRQKQSQIERLAQGSTSAVRAQSDLEIRKRMEQDRLFRSLAYFVEALPFPAVEVRGASAEAPKVIERFDATIEMSLPVSDEPLPADDATVGFPEGPIAPTPEVDVVTVTPEEMEAHTRPISLSSVDMTLGPGGEEVRTDNSEETAPIKTVAGQTAEESQNRSEVKKTETKS